MDDLEDLQLKCKAIKREQFEGNERGVVSMFPFKTRGEIDRNVCGGNQLHFHDFGVEGMFSGM